MSTKVTLSVIIITFNEAENIARCLESVKWADEIIVVDSGSTDNTVEICQQFKAKIHQQTWLGYGPQKNVALQHATGEWILSLDADEQLSPELEQRIKTIMSTENSKDAYQIKRPVVFYHQVIKHACGAEQTVRLFKRGKAQFSTDMVHEKVLVSGSIGVIEQPIYHYSFANVATVINKMNKYTDLVAQQRYEQGKKGSIIKAVTHALWMFIRVYFLKLGFLDGRLGFVLAMSFAEGAYYRYVKLYYLNQRDSK